MSADLGARSDGSMEISSKASVWVWKPRPQPPSPTNPESEEPVQPKQLLQVFLVLNLLEMLLKSLRKTSELELDFPWVVGRF